MCINRNWHYVTHEGWYAIKTNHTTSTHNMQQFFGLKYSYLIDNKLKDVMTVKEGDPRASFSITTTPRYREVASFFRGLPHFTHTL